MVSNWDEILPASKQHWDEKVIPWDESSQGENHRNDFRAVQTSYDDIIMFQHATVMFQHDITMLQQDNIMFQHVFFT